MWPISSKLSPSAPGPPKVCGHIIMQNAFSTVSKVHTGFQSQDCWKSRVSSERLPVKSEGDFTYFQHTVPRICMTVPKYGSCWGNTGPKLDWKPAEHTLNLASPFPASTSSSLLAYLSVAFFPFSWVGSTPHMQLSLADILYLLLGWSPNICSQRSAIFLVQCLKSFHIPQKTTRPGLS